MPLVESALTGGTSGLSPHLEVEVEHQIGDAKVVEHRVISDPDEHMEHKADRLKQWFSRDGLEQHVKWMDDVRALVSPGRAESPFVRDTRHGRELRGE